MFRKALSVSALSSLGMALAFAALAQTASPSPSATPVEKKVDTACMQAAVDKRDTAIIGGVDAYYAAVKSALEARRTALKDGWGVTERKARRAALRAGWNAYKAASKKARKDLKAAKTASWKQFRADRKACGPNGASDDQTGEGIDAQL